MSFPRLFAFTYLMDSALTSSYISWVDHRTTVLKVVSQNMIKVWIKGDSAPLKPAVWLRNFLLQKLQ